MKKIICLILLISVAVFFAERPAFAAKENPLMKDSLMDRISDWFATRGMSKEEKDQVLLQRKTARIYKRTEKQMDKKAKEMEKSFRDFQKTLSGQ